MMQWACEARTFILIWGPKEMLTLWFHIPCINKIKYMAPHMDLNMILVINLARILDSGVAIAITWPLESS